MAKREKVVKDVLRVINGVLVKEKESKAMESYMELVMEMEI